MISMPVILYCLASVVAVSLLVVYLVVRVVVLRRSETVHERMNRAWMRLPREDKLGHVMSCARCNGTAVEPEYGDDDPCIDCGGYAFDRFDVDLRRMRLLGVD